MAAQRDDPELFALFVKTYKDAGIDLIVAVLPPRRCAANVRAGDMVGYLFSDYAIGEYFKDMEVVRIGFGSDPIYRRTGVAWVRASEVEKWSDRSQWPNARVGVLLGIPATMQLAELTGSKNFVQISAYQNIVKMLEADRFDMIVLPEGYLDPQTAGLKIVTLGYPVGEILYWHILPEKFAGTPAEKRIRAAFLANRSAFEKLSVEAIGR
jgi:hypothetical protein